MWSSRESQGQGPQVQSSRRLRIATVKGSGEAVSGPDEANVWGEAGPMPFLCPGIWECLRLRTQGRQRCGRHSDVWSLCPLLPQTASFMSGHQVSTVSRSPSNPYLRQMSAGSCPSKTFKDSAGSAPDTWWPPDLQNVIQGRCGRQAGKQASK